VAGLSVGAVHPLGVAVSAAAWVATIRLATALGAYAAVQAASAEKPGGPSAPQSGGQSGSLFWLLLACALAFLPWALGRRAEPAIVAAVSPPFLALLAPMTGPEVSAALGHGSPVGVRSLGIDSRPGAAAWLAAAALLGPALLTLLARRLERATDRGFDAAVGRTDREENTPEDEERREESTSA
jgi:hypothetical protein